MSSCYKCYNEKCLMNQNRKCTLDKWTVNTCFKRILQKDIRKAIQTIDKLNNQKGV